MKVTDHEFITALISLKDFLDGDHNNVRTVDAIFHVQNALVQPSTPNFTLVFMKGGLAVRLAVSWTVNLAASVRERRVEVSVGGISLPTSLAVIAAELTAQAAKVGQEIERILPERVEF